MSKFDRKLLFGGLGLVAAAAVAGTALAANNTTPDTNAGQGVAVVAGFTVSDVEYTTNTTGTVGSPSVSGVSFTIVRDGTTSGTAVDDTNATVSVQLRDGATNADWASCSVTAGAATCTTTGSAGLPVGDVDGISVVAYDSAPVTTTTTAA